MEWGVILLKKRMLLSGFILIFSLVLIACAGDGEDEEAVEPGPTEEQEPSDETGEINEEVDEELFALTDEERKEDDEVVLIVNGEEVHGDIYNVVYLDFKRYATEEDQPIDDDMLKTQTIDSLTQQTLVKQDATDRGIVVTEQEVNQALEDTKDQFESEEDYFEALRVIGYTEDTFIKLLENQLIQQLYMETLIGDMEVSDEEVEEFYDILTEQMDDAPPLEEVRPQIEQELISNIANRTYAEQIERLESNADIDVLI